MIQQSFENKNNKNPEKIIKIRLEKSSILKTLVGITLILTFINLYWTNNLAKQLASLTGGIVAKTSEQSGTLKEVQPQQPSQQQQQPSEIEVSVDDDPVNGVENAPVTIIEFSDFECPFCARFVEQTLPQIKENYIKAGKVKLVFRDFPLPFHQNAKKAHEAAECADEQGKYWEYHDLLFKNYQSLIVENLKKYAQEMKLDVAKFNECLDSGRMGAEVEKDLRDGANYGVSGTPTFFINGIELVGAQPYSAFAEIIEQELNK